MRRRDFLRSCSAAAVGLAAYACTPAEKGSHDAGEPPFYKTSNVRWQSAYDRALAVLAGNVQVLPRYNKPVLIEGAEYPGVWQECAPQESLVYSRFRPDVARNTHMTFFEMQRPDGQLPANNKQSETGFGQIQMVVPIAATAWELAEATGDNELLETGYGACSRWDAWLMRYRNTRGTGLIEGFCTFDTGHDNSPRWQGIPPQCPRKDARQCPSIPTLPRLCPDLSSTVYGGRIALSAMALALGKTGESERWADAARRIRGLILERLYVADEAAFYDLDAQGQFVRVRSDVLSRVCGEHVPDAKMFSDLWQRQIHNAHAFWAPYPLPSIALDDPAFVRPIPRNSWGGPSQALTALRAGRWFDHYDRAAEFSTMMNRWCEALILDMSFRQQLDPVTGEFTQAAKPDYSPAALVMVDYTWRLAGVRQVGEKLEWNVRPGHPASGTATFRIRLDALHTAELRYEGNSAELRLNAKLLASVSGGAIRLTSDLRGHIESALGIGETLQEATLNLPTRPQHRLKLRANEKIALA